MEKIQVNLDTKTIRKLRQKAYHKGVTISWILRIILRNPNGIEIQNEKRPRVLEGEYRKFDLCLYESKEFWMIYVRAKGCEFGPYLRKLLEYYLPKLESLNYETPRFNRIIRSIRIITAVNGLTIKISRVPYLSLRPKNEKMNRFLMERNQKARNAA